ncbi:cob(I)yrinic acid a,c-diamide adenosyltransferase [Aestuariibacter sp. AA17]|uniref:Corrinoid adenosyltransferase n=1 Tax=Fluctibacter corallii TaxID=2984329 RepID=A0ABT3A937_9ALTE|nr:cob(I)yrinic acid a,c-diamide adenosyltransferase [Aestuariibacter sp. AA17]MCV2885192.1 cob(I)yrinic acid a,c-diamide adenosyltransferase [Aestuariibacter sp. AA17]
MKIYTKKGDQGETQVYIGDAKRKSKADPILHCYGCLDELNAHIGLLVSLLSPSKFDAQLEQIQRNLFQIGFAISATSALTDNDLAMLENQIDVLSDTLPPQTHFILPGGCQQAAQAHVCRTIARRAERELVNLANDHDVPALTLSYINRLSDYFFVLARSLNHENAIADTTV